MNRRRRDRRARRRVVASAVIVSLCAAACSSSGTAATDANTTQPAPSGVPEEHGLSEALVAEVLASTVAISGVACGRLASGSGFAITADLIVTNAHVILGIDEIRVHTFDGRELAGSPVAFDADADLAILEVPGADLQPLMLASDSDTADGSTGILVGWEPAPFPDPTPFRIDRRVTVKIERVAGTEQVERRAWQLAAEIEVGDSGAALIDRSGEVVGVAFAASTEGTGVGYAVRTSEVETLISQSLDPNLIVPDC